MYSVQGGPSPGRLSAIKAQHREFIYLTHLARHTDTHMENLERPTRQRSALSQAMTLAATGAMTHMGHGTQLLCAAGPNLERLFCPWVVAGAGLE